MTRKALIAIMLSLLLLSAATALADGDIYTGGPSGTKITSLPYTISAPGAYYLASNLSYAGGDGITVTSDNVTLDLMGFSLNYTGSGIPGWLLSDQRRTLRPGQEDLVPYRPPDHRPRFAYRHPFAQLPGLGGGGNVL